MGALQYHALTLIIRSPRAIAGFQCGSYGASWRRVKDCCCSVWSRAHLRCQVLEHSRGVRPAPAECAHYSRGRNKDSNNMFIID